MANKVIKNIPYFDTQIEDSKTVVSLVQEQTTFTKVGKKVKNSTETIIIIPDVWEDLKKESGEWKTNDAKNYFYYEVEVSQIGEDSYVTQQVEVPQPQIEVFQKEDGSFDWDSFTSDWAKFWATKFKTSMDNFQKTSVVTPKNIETPKSGYLATMTDGVETISQMSEVKVERPVDQTIETLISTLF